MHNSKPSVAIVDCGLGNLFSVEQACLYAGLRPVITSSKHEIIDAAAVILPGVGAFGDAMLMLHRLDLVQVLRDIAASNKPFIGICLGFQMLMQESHEFGCHKGLGIFEGVVDKLESPKEKEFLLKVPHIGWNRIYQYTDDHKWRKTLLDGTDEGQYMYFVHSYIVHPRDKEIILSSSRYGHIEFCSSISRDNVFACQFHPERSGPNGLKIYRELANRLRKTDLSR